MEFSSPKIKKFLIFSQEKAFLIFREMELFLKTYISGGDFPRLKNKKHTLKKFLGKNFLRKWNFLVPSFKKILMFQEETCKA